MKKVLFLIMILSSAAPAYAVIVTERTPEAMTIQQGAQASPQTTVPNYPRPAYYENGRPVYVNTPQPPRKRCRDNLGQPAPCPRVINNTNPATKARPY